MPLIHKERTYLALEPRGGRQALLGVPNAWRKGQRSQRQFSLLQEGLEIFKIGELTIYLE